MVHSVPFIYEMLTRRHFEANTKVKGGSAHAQFSKSRPQSSVLQVAKCSGPGGKAMATLCESV